MVLTRPLAPLLVAACALAACGTPRHPPEAEGTRCDRCHGTGALGAPPPAFNGATAPQDPAVGAHAAHLASDLAHPAVSCDDCHVMPRTVSSPGHMSPADLVVFGPRARAGGATPTWDRATGTCSGTACHAQPGAAAPAPRWVETGLLPGARCARCHGGPPPRPHPVWSACDRCHGGGTATAPGVVPGPGHLDGAVDAVRVHPAGWVRRAAHGAAALGGDASCRECHGPDLMSASSPLSCAGCHGAGGVSCGSCHGAPPATGAHARHHDGGGAPAYGAVTVLAQDGAPGAGYRFGCGQCHPLDDLRHLDGAVDVDLSPTGAPAGSLKARNGPGAAYLEVPGEPVGRCAEVACHSSGQGSPTFVTTPRWDEAGLGCDGCHGNPPRYASSGPDGASPNGHLYPYPSTPPTVGGHFGGFPASGHGGERHGDATTGAAIVSCQACHSASVDPAATGPSGIYWLDTTGNFSLPDVAAGPDCAGCHAGLSPALVRKGAARPLAHVNGTRDVVFDPRTSVTAAQGYTWPAATPAFPYWVASTGITTARADVAQDGRTVSLHLGAAAYDAATRTCTNVACHLAQTEVRWGTPPAGGSCACRRCHAELFGPPPPGVCP